MNDKKKADVADVTKKFDLNNIVNSLKSMVNVESDMPEVDADDALGLKIKELTQLTQQVVDVQAQQVKDINKIQGLLVGAFKDITALRAQYAKPAKKPKKSEKPTTLSDQPGDDV